MLNTSSTRRHNTRVRHAECSSCNRLNRERTLLWKWMLRQTQQYSTPPIGCEGIVVSMSNKNVNVHSGEHNKPWSYQKSKRGLRNIQPIKYRHNKQDLQCTYNVIQRRVRATIAAVKEQYYIFWVRVCRLTHTACNAHAPHRHLSPVPLYNIFPRYLIKDTFFGPENVFWFSLQPLWTHFSILRRTDRCKIINVHRYSPNVPVIPVRF